MLRFGINLSAYIHPSFTCFGEYGLGLAAAATCVPLRLKWSQLYKIIGSLSNLFSPIPLNNQPYSSPIRVLAVLVNLNHNSGWDGIGVFNLQREAIRFELLLGYRRQVDKILDDEDVVPGQQPVIFPMLAVST